MFRKATLRKMPPKTRQYARLLNDLESVLRRGKNMVEEISRLELDSKALAHAKGMPAAIQGHMEKIDFDQEGNNHD